MNQDKKMINACVNVKVDELFPNQCPEYPLDTDIIGKLKSLEGQLREDDDDYQLFRHRKTIDELWVLLLEKAIKCLRYCDSREPFMASDPNKRPKAYGIDDLKKYYQNYTKFEQVLYGTGRYYRDHVIHVMRTWLSGVDLLVRNNGNALGYIKIHDKNVPLELKPEEKLSIWTIIALTHDLGYPLEKAKSIISITQEMLGSFIANPDISVDFSFHGVQNYMNDYIVRLMSSKMESRPSGSEERYVARLQSKYYFKFQKSLERNRHGILSTLIIYKLLTYFLESDYNLNEDYYFNKEDCRQFYIRREIIRAIASHTCDDIYQMYMGSFSFLLRICDDTQEWGRKNLSELYVKSNQTYELKDIDLFFCLEGKGQTQINKCTVDEQIGVPDKESAINLIRRFRDQALVYVTIFRDGQDTISRDFSFVRKLEIKTPDVPIALTLEVDKDRASQLQGILTLTSDSTKNQPFGKEFAETLSTELGVKCEYKLYDASEKKLDLENKHPANWRKAELEIPLIG